MTAGVAPVNQTDDVVLPVTDIVIICAVVVHGDRVPVRVIADRQLAAANYSGIASFPASGSRHRGSLRYLSSMLCNACILPGWFSLSSSSSTSGGAYV